MIAALFVLVAGQSSFNPGMPDIPTAMSPMQTAGIPHEEHTETANPWKFSSNMVDGTTDLLSRIKHAKHEGSDVNPEENAKLMQKMGELSDEVAAEADKIAANERQQDANDDGIRQEGKDLVTVHHNQMGESSLYNLAANSANQIWKSEHNWQSALEQAGKVENFVAAADTDVIGVLGQGAQALDDAQTELTDLEKNAEAQVDELDQNCAQKLLDWSAESTTMLNDQTRTLKMVYERVDRMQKVFDKGHSLVVTLLQLVLVPGRVGDVRQQPRHHLHRELQQRLARDLVQAGLRRLPFHLHPGPQLQEEEPVVQNASIIAKLEIMSHLHLWLR